MLAKIYVCYDILTIILEYVVDDTEIIKLGNNFKKACLYNRGVHLKNLSYYDVNRIFRDNIDKLTNEQKRQIVHDHMSIVVLNPNQNILGFHNFLIQKCKKMDVKNAIQFNNHQIRGVRDAHAILHSVTFKGCRIYEDYNSENIVDYIGGYRWDGHNNWCEHYIDIYEYFHRKFPTKTLLKEVKSIDPNNNCNYLVEYILDLYITNSDGKEISDAGLDQELADELLNNVEILDQYDFVQINNYGMEIRNVIKFHELGVYVSYTSSL
jgi:hypothetical protein